MRKIFTLVFVSLLFKSIAIKPACIEALNTFDAIYNKKIVSFKWTLNNPEGNIGMFTIERSKDGKVYDKVSEVKISVNGTNEIEFLDTDSKPLKKKSFYRLKYTDEAGQETYSRVVYVQKATEKPKLKVSISQDQQGIELKQFKKDEQVVIVVRDKEGTEYFSKSVFMNSGNKLILTREMHLAAGEYIIVASSQSNLYSNTFTIP